MRKRGMGRGGKWVDRTKIEKKGKDEKAVGGKKGNGVRVKRDSPEAY